MKSNRVVLAGLEVKEGSVESADEVRRAEKSP